MEVCGYWIVRDLYELPEIFYVLISWSWVVATQVYPDFKNHSLSLVPFMDLTVPHYPSIGKKKKKKKCGINF